MRNLFHRSRTQRAVSWIFSDPDRPVVLVALVVVVWLYFFQR